MLTTSDQAVLRTLASDARVSTEQVDAILQDTVREADEPARVYVVVGRRLVLPPLLERMAGTEAADAAFATGGRAMLLARSPLAAWTGHQHITRKIAFEEPLIALAADGFDALARAELRIGHAFPLAVLASDMRSPMDADDQAMLRALASLAILLKIVWIRRPGVEPTTRDLSDLEGMALKHARSGGFGDGRFAGSSVVDVDVPSPLAADEIATLFSYDVAEVRRHASAPSRRQLLEILGEIERRHPALDVSPELTLTDEDRARLQRAVDGHLTALVRQLQRSCENGTVQDTAALRRLTIDTIDRWLGGAVLEASDFVFAEKGSPGLMAEFRARAAAAVDALSLDIPAAATAPGRTIGERLKAFVLGAIAGVLSLTVGYAVLSRFVPDLLAWGAGIALGLLGMLTGARLVLRAPRVDRIPPRGPRVIGTEALHAALSSAFADLIRRPGSSARERLARLRAQVS